MKKNKMTAEQKELYKKIDEILWSDWDPIGINDDEDWRSEYESYALRIFGLVIHGADKFAIAKQLYIFESEHICLAANLKHCENVAEKILNEEIQKSIITSTKLGS